jgi:hypothetical protein
MAKPIAAMLCLILTLPAPLARAREAAAAPAQAEDVWPFPPPDPKSWWDDPRPKLPEAADPLGGRKLGRGEGPVTIDNGTEPNGYRLWGLQPLQVQVVRPGEMILEVQIRPSGGVRQSIVRVTVRGDGKAFVQVRAGLACCEPGIARRVGFDAQTDPAPFRALADHPMWSAPRNVRVAEAGAVDDAICVDGTAYDLTLVLPGQSRALRRACDDAAIGEVADALEPLLHAALGHEARFDVLFPRGADFSGARQAYRSLLDGGGKLAPAR